MTSVRVLAAKGSRLFHPVHRVYTWCGLLITPVSRVVEYADMAANEPERSQCERCADVIRVEMEMQQRKAAMR